MNYKNFAILLSSADAPVVLLEGTRALPASDAPKLTALAARLARNFPTVRFRTGNAKGSDEAFAAGVASVDPARIEYVLPYSGHRQGQRSAQSPATGLDEIPPLFVEDAVTTTALVSPQYRHVTDKYPTRPTSPRQRAIAQLILRDTVKVTGTTDLPPPIAGIFYVNAESPDDGGTGHTIRVCRAKDVPTITQNQWMDWAG